MVKRIVILIKKSCKYKNQKLRGHSLFCPHIIFSPTHTHLHIHTPTHTRIPTHTYRLALVLSLNKLLVLPLLLALQLCILTTPPTQQRLQGVGTERDKEREKQEMR